MPSLVLVKNPLSPLEHEVHALRPGERPIDWLLEHYPPPDGCGGAVRYFINGRERDLDDLDYVPLPDDVIGLAVQPAGLESILISVAISVALTAASMGLQALLASGQSNTPPAFARTDNFTPSPVYSVRLSQNTARLAEPVPVVYGTVLMTPDLVNQPYRFYYGGGEYLDFVLCLGAGEMNVNDVLLSDSNGTEIQGGAFQWHVATPAEHLNAIGNLAGIFADDMPPFWENVVTSLEVGEQEMTDPSQMAGFFRVGKPGQLGRYIIIDFLWPQGLFQIVPATGDVNSTGIDASVLVQEVDENGVAIAGTDLLFDITQFGADRNPLRYTYIFDCGRSASWQVHVTRNTVHEPSGGETNRWIWTGLHMLVDNTSLPAGGAAYGNVVLLCVRIFATSISSSANNQIRARVTRKLPPLAIGAATTTRSPADAFADILCNTDYGARRPAAELDHGTLQALKTYWGAHGYNYSFSGVYTGKTTVYQALTDVLQVVAAAPLPLGGLMSAVQDGIKDTRTMLFTEQNIGRGTFSLAYNFDHDGAHDGVEVEYRDPNTFVPAFVRQPNASQDPDKITLFGCADFRHASEYALLMWQRRQKNRRAVSFDTECEGLIPVLGQRMAVAHTLPRWGQSGFVVAVDTATLTVQLDRNLIWDDPSLSPPYVMMFRDQFGGVSDVVEVTRGPTDDIAVMAADPWGGATGLHWFTDPSVQERTHFAFGDGMRAVKDFILSELRPGDSGRVSITGIYYDPSIYAGTFAFLAFPVPT